MKHQILAFCDKKGAVRSIKSLDFKEARNSFYFLQTSFTNSFQIQFGLSYQCEIYHRNKWNVIESLYHIFSRKPVIMATI